MTNEGKDVISSANGTDALRIGSHKPLSRRDYFIGCALQALVRTRPMETSIETVAQNAVAFGNAVESAIGAE